MQHAGVAGDLTLVTAILDLGRDALAPRFARPFSHYLEGLRQLLRVNVPLVFYGDGPSAELIAAGRDGDHTRLVPTTTRDLERFPYFSAVQRIRTSPAWRAQVGWLADSPQAQLLGYNPLVMLKLYWLAEQARANPFGTHHFAWIDGAVTHTVPIGLLAYDQLAANLVPYLDRFLLLCFPYPGGREIHGFERHALATYAHTNHVDWVARGGFFGGRAEYIQKAVMLYDAILEHTLARGHMGTEESVLTILAHLHPQMFTRYTLAADGLMYRFFEAVKRGHEAR